MFCEGCRTHDIDSAEVFNGVDSFGRYFALKGFLNNRSLKLVWADPPIAVTVRVNNRLAMARLHILIG
jgi:hypothetical protein